MKKKGKKSLAKHSLFAFVRNCLVAGDFLVQSTGTVKIKGKKDSRSIMIVTRESLNTNLYGSILECIISWFHCSSAIEAILPCCRVTLKCVPNWRECLCAWINQKIFWTGLLFSLFFLQFSLESSLLGTSYVSATY